ncbi:T-cell immunoglobulin and mucin domain-containing protein 4-like isoform X1 [Paralichthys olivaceus]|uniref:T-cell immunoglobulin and mucin domain-containing protein 4-like isoform X1 n=1 Tax=Paralichthys olivaceus TaxID=8255 RepID=UPI003752DEE3
MKLLLLLAVLSVGEGDNSARVAGRAGDNVTLSCHYNVTTNGFLSVCWNRGTLSAFKCNNPLIAVDKLRVREGSRVSSRYQLLGQLHQGNVSLTILNVTETDTGPYGCRVDIPGWFNDDKHHFDLTVDSAPQTTTSGNSETSTMQTTDTHTAGHMNATETVLSSTFSSIIRQPESSSLTVAVVYVLFGLIVSTTASGAAILVRKWMGLHKVRQQQQLNGSVQFSLSGLQSQSRESVVDNIYEREEDVNTVVYESCP